MRNLVFQEGNDALITMAFPDMDLLDACVAWITDKLVHNPRVVVFGKECVQRRDVGFFCDDENVPGYHYSGQLMRSQPCGELLQTLLQQVNAMFGAQFNAILINRYTSGDDYIGKHSDDERNLSGVNGVVSISWGAERTLRFRRKETNEIVWNQVMKHGECVQMFGETFQQKFTHEIPVQKKVRGTRISFTFRHHVA